MKVIVVALIQYNICHKIMEVLILKRKIKHNFYKARDKKKMIIIIYKIFML